MAFIRMIYFIQLMKIINYIQISFFLYYYAFDFFYQTFFLFYYYCYSYCFVQTDPPKEYVSVAPSSFLAKVCVGGDLRWERGKRRVVVC